MHEDGTKKWVTARDVAKRAGVSQTLVSFMLTGQRPVSPEAARRIQEAVDELGYDPNGPARSLRSKRSGVIGLLVPDLTNPSFAIMAAAAEATLAEGRLLTFICSSGRHVERADSYFRALRSARAEGLLIFPAPEAVEEILTLSRQGVRVVLLEREIPHLAAGAPLDAVVVDVAAGVHAATDHLIRLGHDRIALLNLAKDSWGSAARLSGYRTALEAHGREVDETLISWRPGTVQAGRESVLELLALSPRPTAVVVTANLQTVGVVGAVAEFGLRVPGDLSIVGFGHPGFDFWPAVSLTVISHDADAVGREAAKLLLDRLSTKLIDSTQRLVLPCDLEVRGSTGPPH
jgi:LacI family transcriptional regulator